MVVEESEGQGLAEAYQVRRAVALLELLPEASGADAVGAAGDPVPPSDGEELVLRVAWGELLMEGEIDALVDALAHLLDISLRVAAGALGEPLADAREDTEGGSDALAATEGDAEKSEEAVMPLALGGPRVPDQQLDALPLLLPCPLALPGRAAVGETLGVSSGEVVAPRADAVAHKLGSAESQVVGVGLLL